MSLIALASVKASPGVTTAALALGAVWPVPRQAVVVELDPLGGDLAARFGLAFEPGLLTLAAAVRRKDRAAALQEHVQQLLGKLPVIVGPASPEQAEAAIHLVSERVLSPACEPGDTDVIADCGCLYGQSPALAALGSSDLLLLVTRAVLSELQHVAAWLPALTAASPRIALVLVGRGDYSAHEVAQTLGVEIAGWLPQDAHGAAVLSGTRALHRGTQRLPLLRSARALASMIIATLLPVIGDEPIGDRPTPTGQPLAIEGTP